MAIFMDSFQYATANLSRKWNQVSNTVAITTTYTPYPRQLRVINGASVATKVLSSSNVWSAAFPFMFTSNPIGSRPILLFRDGTTTQISIYLTATGEVDIRKGFVTHASTTGPVTDGSILTGSQGSAILMDNTWYYFEVKATFSASIGANDFQVRVTGPLVNETITLAAGQSTIQSANPSADRIFIYGAGTSYTRDAIYGSMYLDNGQASLLGNVRVAALSPDGNGATNQWVGSDANSVDNFLLVDEVTPDDDTTFVSSSVNGQVDLYELTNLPTPAASVLAVQCNAQSRKLDANDVRVEPVYRIGGVDYIDSPIPLGTGYYNIDSVRSTSPATSSPWTGAEINAMQVGVRSDM